MRNFLASHSKPGALPFPALAPAFLLAASVLATPALAQAPAPAVGRHIELSRQPAAEAVRRLIESTGIQILYSPSALHDIGANAVRGNMTEFEALSSMFRDTGVEVIETGPGAATLRRATPHGAGDDTPTVIVTARKFAESLAEVPIAVSVLSGKALARRGAASVADGLRDVPGISIYDAGSGLSRISIRGISTSLGGNENGFYVDDVPFSGVSVPISPDVRAWDLERVEVLRGPQGTLFGEGSMGGTIRTMSNNARLDKFAFAASTGLSRTEGGGDSRAAKLMVNLPLVDDMLAVRIAATDETMAGWLDAAPPGPADINAGQVKTARLRALFRPSEQLSVNATYWRYKGRYDAGVYATDAGIAPRALQLDSSPGYILRGINGSYDFDRVQLFYGYSKNSYALPQSGLLSGAQFDAGIRIGIATHELRLSSRTQTPWRWTAGLYTRKSARNDVLRYPSQDIDQRGAEHSSASSVFGEIAYALPSLPLEASLGLRHFRDRLSSEVSNHDIAEPAASNKFSSNNPRLSLSYRPAGDWQLYTSAAKGFRSGQTQITGFERIAQANHVAIAPVIRPDSIWTYEIGTKLAMPERRLGMELALYHSDWKDVAVRSPLGASGLNVLINSNGTRTDGIDATVSYAPTTALDTTFAAGFVKARYAGTVANTGIVDGSPVDDVPRFTMSAGASYRFGFIAGWRGVARAGIQHAGAHRNATFTPYLAGDAINNVNGRLSFSKGRWTVSLYGENLANDRGATSYRTVEAVTATTSETYAARLRPRTIGVDLVYAME